MIRPDINADFIRREPEFTESAVTRKERDEVESVVGEVSIRLWLEDVNEEPHQSLSVQADGRDIRQDSAITCDDSQVLHCRLWHSCQKRVHSLDQRVDHVLLRDRV